MILDLKLIRQSGKVEEDFFFLYEPQSQLISIPNAKIEGQIKINGKIVLSDLHKAVVSGEVCYTVKGDCTRCLTETSKTYVVTFDVSCGEDDEESFAVINDKIDLSKIVDETVIVNAPSVLLCKEDCKGICTGCGVNLNEENCKCNK